LTLKSFTTSNFSAGPDGSDERLKQQMPMESTPLPANYPAEYIEEAMLKDGRRVTLRPIRPDDAPRLQEGFTRLSPETIYMRFFEAASALSDEQARELATVDYQQRMAFVGSVQEEGQERLVAVARYSITPQREPVIAEAAIVVRDDYQGQGLGKQAMKLLVRYARTQGVMGLYATVHTANARILNFIRSSGLPFQRKMLEPGVWEITLWFEPPVDLL
jgi:RimJ/RimL family protein N-acetyltransferase